MANARSARPGAADGGGRPRVPAGLREAAPAGPTTPEMDEEELAQQMAAMRAELANSPVEVVVANHCYGLFELAAVYLSQQPAMLSPGPPGHRRPGVPGRAASKAAWARPRSS